MLWHKLRPSPPLSQAGFSTGRAYRQSWACDGWVEPRCSGPAKTVCSSRTLGRMIRATLLPDLTYWHRRTQYGARAGVREWHRVILLKVHLPPHPSSALVISRSKRLFIICNMWCSDPAGREKGKWRARGGRMAFSSLLLSANLKFLFPRLKCKMLLVFIEGAVCIHHIVFDG